ncbi:MAG: hypothetical protein KIS79_07520 [Burkholderiales bacterium]|nr:hypothetical protein [Burkholderiales bacterium]
MRLTIPAAVAIAALCGQAQALPFTSYDSLFSWGAAVQTYKTDTLFFSPTVHIPGDPDDTPEKVLVDVKYEDFRLYNPHIHFAWTLGNGTVGGEMHSTGFEDSRAQYFTLTFDTPLKAIAFNLSSLPGDNGTPGGALISVGQPYAGYVFCEEDSCVQWSGEGDLSPIAPSDFLFMNGEHFFGIISAQPFSTLTITKPYLLYNQYEPEMDDSILSSGEDWGYIYLGAISYKHWQVPEPATLALLPLAWVACRFRRSGT